MVRRGADWERRARDELLRQGAVHVVRAAGSLGPVDLVAFFPNGPAPVRWVSVKAIHSRERERRYVERKELAALAALRAPPYVQVELWSHVRREGWRVLRPPGPQGGEER